jgi:MFS superfamily sulfate permease-like transporter
MKTNKLPSDGWKGLVENWKSDLPSGFIVALLALPLSLGIASASDFPPIFGLITAMIGGVIVSFLAGSLLTIKGPAAGLIVIVAGAVGEFALGAPAGSSTADATAYGWHLALGAVVIAGILQVIFGLLKFGSFSDFFPLSAVHGMLAAIGIIILSKQLHILVGMNPVTESGKPMVEPLELLGELKNTFSHFFEHKEVFIIGLISLVIVFVWPMLKIQALKKVPAALVVLVVAIPLGKVLHLQNVNGFAPLLEFKKGLFDTLGVNVSFDGMSMVGTFVKYVVMFALVGSLEALLTVKATDMLDPFRRKSNANKDLIAVGVGNIIAGILGGLPMISEVARSSSNVSNGAKTRWANFFHGVVILIFLIFAVSFSDMIPKAALAALLIGVGIKLAHPREFIHMFQIGKEQLLVFIVTIVFTLVADLLVGIAAGILTKMIVLLVNGASLSSLFKAQAEVAFVEDKYEVRVSRAAVFTNFVAIKHKLEAIPAESHITIFFENSRVIDHSAMEQLHLFKMIYEREGGVVVLEGLDEHKSFSRHDLAGRKKKKQ